MTTCKKCGGTKLAPSIIGAERGTCSCKRPGRIIRRKVDGLEQYEYDVLFENDIFKVDPPTLSNAHETLERFRDSFEVLSAAGAEVVCFTASGTNVIITLSSATALAHAALRK